MAGYSLSRSNGDVSTFYPSGDYVEIERDISESANKTWSLGPYVMLGVRSVLVDRVSVSAEMGFSALYQWTTWSNSSLTTNTYTSPYGSTTTNNNGSVSHLEGWNLTLATVRIGLVIEV